MLTHLCSMLFFLPSTYTHISPLSHNLLLFISPRPLINSYLYERPRQKSVDKRRAFAKYILTPLISSCHLVFQHRFTSFPHNLKRRKIPEDSSQQARGERERKKELKSEKSQKAFRGHSQCVQCIFPSDVSCQIYFRFQAWHAAYELLCPTCHHNVIRTEREKSFSVLGNRLK